jgi:hypothetical protein
MNNRINKIDEELTRRIDDMYLRIQDQLDAFDDRIFKDEDL